jgi:hypothetical protein
LDFIKLYRPENQNNTSHHQIIPDFVMLEESYFQQSKILYA